MATLKNDLNQFLKVALEEQDLVEHIQTLEQYLDQKRELKDWHAVWDAAVDLYKSESCLKTLRTTRDATIGKFTLVDNA